jgi:hypothetical protein
MKTACIITDHTHETLSYAARELRFFLERTTALKVVHDDGRAPYRFVLAVDSVLKETQYALRVAKEDRRTMITLAGHDTACVLHAVYELLERCGIWFDALGPLLPDSLNLSALATGETVVTPTVKKRGIRQHINFTMDISSYPLAEALEYVRNLARLRMNHITFHSYHGQWYGYPENGEHIHGGNFFYGTRHDLPKEELFSRIIRNRTVYCIPEIEAVVDQPGKRSQMATEWLNAVMAECRRIGMHVQLSIEPTGKTHAEGVAICRDVMKLYPQIDTFELVTPECGNSLKCLTVDELRIFLVELFGERVLDDHMLVSSLKEGLDQLEGGLRNVARNIRIVEELQAERGIGAKPAFIIGAYITCADSLKVLLSVMRRFVPDSMALSFLPSHGARRAVANLTTMGFDKKTIQRTMLYSWIEFDGNMYLQQNSVEGARQLVEFAQAIAGADQVEGVAFNHWRTAENRLCIGYVARACLQGPIQPLLFYKGCAGAFGVMDANGFARLMQELDELDNLAREKMFNIGFCVNACWVRPGLNWTKLWDADTIDAARGRYAAVSQALAVCLETAARPSGRELLWLLINRIECTMIHLECAQALKNLTAFCDHAHPDLLTDHQKKIVTETCDRAMDLAQRYIARHAEAILDRGCEGTLISYQTVIPNYIEHIRSVFVVGEVSCSHFLPQFDEPPPPAA